MFFLIPVFVHFIGQVLLITGDMILFRSPFPQVQQSASFRAERPEWISIPCCFFLTHRTTMFSCLVFHGSAFGR